MLFLFIGRVNVPDKVRDYIQGSDIDVGVLIGNELIGAATFIRRQLGISVFVKFAQGSRTPTGPVAQVEDLDRFPMPRFELLVSIESIVYNRATGQLEVTFSNDAEIAAYIKSTITVILQDGTSIVLGDDAPIFLDGNELKTVTYAANIPEGDSANASVFTIFGEAPQSLENTLEATVKIDFVEVNDDAQINITDLYYDKGKGQFFLEIKNTGDTTVYIDAELLDLIINDEKVTVGGDLVLELKPGAKGLIPISVDLDEQDILDNEIIKVQARYGERKLALIKFAYAEFEFKEKSGNLVTYGLIVLVVLIILWFLFFRKKKCPKCGKRGTLESKGNKVKCNNCSYSATRVKV